MFSFVCVCVCVDLSISTYIESVFWSWNNNLQQTIFIILFTHFFSWVFLIFLLDHWFIVEDWNVTLEQTNQQTNKRQRNWTLRKLVEWVDGFQDNKTFCFVLFLFCFQFLVSKYWGEFRVDLWTSLLFFFFFFFFLLLLLLLQLLICWTFFNSIHSLYYLQLCFFSTLLVHQLMQRNNIWEWLENPLVF